MNTKFKAVRLVLAAAFGSLLWAGCATERTYYGDVSNDLRPVDLTERRAGTHPEWRTGSEHLAGWDGVVDAPVGVVVEEAAGAERPR